MTSAKMRSMMQGIVVTGTGKKAALNGYSAGGKTGTANKIDPATHTYSHTKLVASFAGFAPVSNPAISVAVVIDTPTVGTRYGGETSAPVFAEVAQQVLEYLGVPHDQPLKPKKELQFAREDVFDDTLDDHGVDINKMFADINDLPADDPLRNPDDVKPAMSVASASAPAKSSGSKLANLLPAKVVAAFHANGGNSSESEMQTASAPLPTVAPAVQPRAGAGVVVDAGHRVQVPSFEGLSLRMVVEKASSLGLHVQPTGSGLAREQAPVAGTSVSAGTEIVVRFSR
jgi:cell division protein FtsI (penicillin-binding protein 3)